MPVRPIQDVISGMSIRYLKRRQQHVQAVRSRQRNRQTKMTKAQAQEFARMGQDGIAWVVRPSHSLHDTDIVFGLSTGKVEADFNLVSAFAAEVVSDAIVNAVKHAKTLAKVPGYAGV